MGAASGTGGTAAPLASTSEEPVAPVEGDSATAVLGAFKALAADQAIEDCLYALEQALRNGNLDPADYIKKVRILSRKQFYHRALALKVAQLQQAAPPIHRSASGDQGWVHVGR